MQIKFNSQAKREQIIIKSCQQSNVPKQQSKTASCLRMCKMLLLFLGLVIKSSLIGLHLKNLSSDIKDLLQSSGTIWHSLVYPDFLRVMCKLPPAYPELQLSFLSVPLWMLDKRQVIFLSALLEHWNAQMIEPLLSPFLSVSSPPLSPSPPSHQNRMKIREAFWGLCCILSITSWVRHLFFRICLSCCSSPSWRC